MKTLAVDTTTPWGSAALVEAGAVCGEVRLRAEGGHSRSLVPSIAFLLERLGIAPLDVEGYAVTVGPGSFTGLRVGLSTVQGLALASRRPCLGVSTLDVLAARIRGAGECLVAMIDAYRAQVYARVYDAEARPLGPPAAEDPAALLGRLPPRPAFSGDGAVRYRETILASRPDAVFPDRSLFLAGTLGRLAEVQLARGEGAPPASLRPLYLRQAEIRPSRR
jgi:tRNA threonylcarbamoyladenosine biosynthesis protein TsaB